MRDSLKNVKHISSQLPDNESCSVGIIAEYAERQKNLTQRVSKKRNTINFKVRGTYSRLS